MYKLGILGYPLGHSLSPFMHNAALKNLGLSGSYEKLEYPPEELENAVKFIKDNGFSGVNVTIPFKIDIIKYLDEIDSAAQAVGAVNTLKISKEGKITGYNTDVYGFLGALGDIETGKTAAIIGNGGAARAVIYGLVTAGFKNINIYARNTVKSKELVKFAVNLQSKSTFHIEQLTENIDLKEIHLLVNTTPLGMYGKFEGISPVSLESLKTMPADGIVYDIVYKPEITKFLEYSKLCDLKTVKGIEMLVLQGAKSFEIWTEQTAPVDVMRQSAVENL